MLPLLALFFAAGQATRATTVSAQISGRVLDDSAYRPLANTRVFLYPVPFPTGLRPSLSITNHDGEFVFPHLEPGSYRLGTNKLGYLPTPGVETLIILKEGETRENIDLTMTRGATLAGRVFDQSGQPLRNIGVGALQVVEGTRTRLVPSVATDQTNELGEFRVQSLLPGRYVLVANLTSGPIGAVADGVLDSLNYFPGTLDLSSARTLEVARGATVGGLDFMLLTAPHFGVSGIVIDEFARPVSGAVVALDAEWPLFGGRKGSSGTDADGRFRMNLLAPGDYRLTVTPPGTNPTPITGRTPFVRVHVSENDVVDLAIQFPIR
jgi:protocatechuate 3,4-dioxygenase beta subunit